MSKKHKSCSKAGRCNADECVPSECKRYTYNHKRFKSFTREIEVEMTDEELVAVGDLLVAAKDRLAIADEEQADAMAEHKKIKKEEDAIINDCVRMMKSKKKTLQKEVEECFNYIDGTYIAYTFNDGETIIVEERELSESERQQEMDLVLDEVPAAEAKEPEEGIGEESEDKDVDMDE